MNIREECGAFGVFSKAHENMASLVYHGLYALQHRGQEVCGVVLNDDSVFTSHKRLALTHNGNLSNALPLRRDLELSQQKVGKP